MKAPWSPDDVRHQYRGRTVAIGGPKHSGKSVFISTLYQQLLAHHPDQVFREAACPDGEGMWSAESDPAIVAKIRQKGQFSPEFVNHTLRSIESLGKRFPLLLVDLGGQRTAENAEILKRCTHLIILSSVLAEIPLWQQFAASEGCETTAYLDSVQVKLDNGKLDCSVRSTVDTTQRPVIGQLFNLDRQGNSDTYQVAVNQLAHWLWEVSTP